jgi:hypothetical protein
MAEPQNPFTEDYMRGFGEGQKHALPSPETTRRLNDLSKTVKELVSLQVDLKVLNERLLNMLEKMSAQKEDVEKIENRLSKMETSYASLATKVSVGASILAIAATTLKDVILK